jgi:hypothetical protein
MARYRSQRVGVQGDRHRGECQAQEPNPGGVKSSESVDVHSGDATLTEDCCKKPFDTLGSALDGRLTRLLPATELQSSSLGDTGTRRLA